MDRLGVNTANKLRADQAHANRFPHMLRIVHFRKDFVKASVPLIRGQKSLSSSVALYKTEILASLRKLTHTLEIDLSAASFCSLFLILLVFIGLVRTGRLADILDYMSIAAGKVAEMLALPEQDRAFLARQLIASLDDTVDADAETQWHDVIDRRSREIEDGKVSCRPVEDVVQDIRNKLHARRQPS